MRRVGFFVLMTVALATALAPLHVAGAEAAGAGGPVCLANLDLCNAGGPGAVINGLGVFIPAPIAGPVCCSTISSEIASAVRLSFPLFSSTLDRPPRT